jgi:hypothetical protein
VIRKCRDGAFCAESTPSPFHDGIANNRLRIANNRLRIANGRLRIANGQLRIANGQLRSSYQRLSSNYQNLIGNYRQPMGSCFYPVLSSDRSWRRRKRLRVKTDRHPVRRDVGRPKKAASALSDYAPPYEAHWWAPYGGGIMEVWDSVK